MKILLFFAALTMTFALHAAKPDRRAAALREWRQASGADDPRELELLAGSGECFRLVRAELGDTALFERLARLLKKNFCRYDRQTVDSALHLMLRLQGAVDPVRAATDFAHIRSRVELVADKQPERWRSTLDMLDGVLNRLQSEYR